MTDSFSENLDPTTEAFATSPQPPATTPSETAVKKTRRPRAPKAATATPEVPPADKTATQKTEADATDQPRRRRKRTVSAEDSVAPVAPVPQGDTAPASAAETVSETATPPAKPRARKPRAQTASAKPATAAQAVQNEASVPGEQGAEQPIPLARRRGRKAKAAPGREAEAAELATASVPEGAGVVDAAPAEAEAEDAAHQPSKSARRRSRKSRNKTRRATENVVEHDPVVAVPGMGLFAPASMVALASNPMALPQVAAPTAPALRTSQPPMLAAHVADDDTLFGESLDTPGMTFGSAQPFGDDDDADDMLAPAEVGDTLAEGTPGKRRRSRRGGKGRKRNGQNGQNGPSDPSGPSGPSGMAQSAAEEVQPADHVAAHPAPYPAGDGTPATFFGNTASDEAEDLDDDDASAQGIGGTVLAASEHEGDDTSRKSSRSRNRRRASAARKAAAAAAEEARKSDEQEAVKSRGRKMLISVQPDAQVEVVLTHEGLVQEYYIEMVHQTKIRGNIYKGVINNVDTNLQAAFVSFGQAKNGFLQIDEIHPEYWLTHHDAVKGQKYPPIQKVVKVGQEVLVQVVKEPTGNKGAFLTTWVSLAGRFLVLTPGQEQIGISRKVEDGEERNRLRELIKGIEPGPGLGAIVRTVSAGTSKTTLQKDLNFLKRVWKDIRKRATVEKAPCLIYQEPGLATRAVRDYLSDDVSEIWVDDAATADAINEMASLLFPRKSGEADLVHLYEDKGQTLWEHCKIQNQLEEVHAREVTLPSGGRLVFDQTEALMAIDINSGKISGKTNFSSMAHRTNMEAAEAIARQLRLRDIGGQIVIDFIEMRDPKHCQEVEKTLRTAMKNDRARHDVARMSSFGLLEIVRQRTGSSAISITQEPCPHCNGTGMRRNMEWQALQSLRELRRDLRKASIAAQTEVLYTAQPEVAVYLLNCKRAHLAALEKEFGVRLEIRIAGI